MNFSSLEWTVGDNCFPGVRVECGLMAERLHLVFESAFGSAATSFTIDEIAIKDCLRES